MSSATGYWGTEIMKIGNLLQMLLQIVIITMVLSCRDNKYKVVHSWGKGIVDSFGRYIDENDGVTLNVYDEDGLLRYNLILHKDTVLRSSENASIYQNWFLFLDDKKNLWVESSDIGLWVWVNNKNGYVKYDINSRPGDIKVPEQFFKLLPDALRKYIKQI